MTYFSQIYSPKTTSLKLRRNDHLSPAVSPLLSKAFKMFMFFDPIIPLLRAFPGEITRKARTDYLQRCALYRSSSKRNAAGAGGRGTEQKQSTSFKNQGMFRRWNVSHQFMNIFTNVIIFTIYFTKKQNNIYNVFLEIKLHLEAKNVLGETQIIKLLNLSMPPFLHL